MSELERDCVHVLWVCIGQFLKSFVAFFFLKISHLYGKIKMSFLCLLPALCNAACS